MAITKITDPSSLPLTTADYQNQNIQIERLLNNVNQPFPVSGGNIVKGSLFNIGGDMFYCGADTAISGTSSDYVKLVVSGTDAAPEYVASLTGVAWEQAYNGYYDSSGNLYVFDEVKAVLAGAISGYNTAMGAMWRENAGQSLKSTDDVVFNSVKTDNVYLKTKIIEIGVWDMDSTSNVSVAHGLDVNDIRRITVYITNDSLTGGRSLEFSDTLNVDTLVSGDIRPDSTNIVLVRRTDGYFDSNTGYDDGTINRGWIFIDYIGV